MPFKISWCPWDKSYHRKTRLLKYFYYCFVIDKDRFLNFRHFQRKKKVKFSRLFSFRSHFANARSKLKDKDRYSVICKRNPPIFYTRHHTINSCRGLDGQFCILSTHPLSWCLCSQECDKGLCPVQIELEILLSGSRKSYTTA